jgi:hypothetical protein
MHARSLQGRLVKRPNFHIQVLFLKMMVVMLE